MIHYHKNEFNKHIKTYAVKGIDFTESTLYVLLDSPLIQPFTYPVQLTLKTYINWLICSDFYVYRT